MTITKVFLILLVLTFSTARADGGNTGLPPVKPTPTSTVTAETKG